MGRKCSFQFMEKNPLKTRGDRIRWVRQFNRLSQEKFADALETSRGAVGNWELNKGIKTENLSAISQKFKVPMSWLANGTGQPIRFFEDQEYDEETQEIVTVDEPSGGIQEIDVRAGLGGGGTVDQTLAWKHGSEVDPIKPDAWKFPAPFVRNELRRPEDRIKIIETYGDSMSPTIQSGDRVIIDTDHRTPSPDGLYAIRDRFGSIVVKRLQVLRRGDPPVVKIISDNPHHGEEEVAADEIETAIIGRVLWGLKRL